MTDRLKLSDAKGDAEVAKIANALELAENKKRIKELQKNIADLEKLAERKAQLERPAAPSNNKIGARKNARFMAVSTAPSINLTPKGIGMVPVGYTTVQDLSNSVGVAKTVRFNGDPVYLLDSSTQPGCKGDEMGSGGGIRSGTVNGEVKPVKGSSTVRVEGKAVVREGDPCTMNGGNNPGVYVVVPAPSGAAPKDAIATSNPPITLDTPEEQAAFDKWLDKTAEDMRQALKHPMEAVKGAAKGLANTVPGTVELLLKAAAEQRASELDNAAMTQTLFGQDDAAKALSGVAGETRSNADKIDLPKFSMNNPAQEGGDTISAAVQIFAGGVGILKSGAKWLAGLGKGGKAADVASGAGKVMKSEVAEAGPAGDGIKIVKMKDVAGANTAYDNALFNMEARQTQAASTEFVDAVAARRSLFVAKPGTDDFKFLEMTGADASAGGPGNLSILVKSDNPQRLTLMEEFLHGTQSKRWGDPILDVDGADTAFREWHVRDFMSRHSQMLGWDADEKEMLQSELKYWAKKAGKTGK